MATGPEAKEQQHIYKNIDWKQHRDNVYSRITKGHLAMVFTVILKPTYGPKGINTARTSDASLRHSHQMCSCES